TSDLLEESTGSIDVVWTVFHVDERPVRRCHRRLALFQNLDERIDSFRLWCSALLRPQPGRRQPHSTEGQQSRGGAHQEPSPCASPLFHLLLLGPSVNNLVSLARQRPSKPQ